MSPIGKRLRRCMSTLVSKMAFDDPIEESELDDSTLLKAGTFRVADYRRAIPSHVSEQLITAFTWLQSTSGSQVIVRRIRVADIDPLPTVPSELPTPAGIVAVIPIGKADP